MDALRFLPKGTRLYKYGSNTAIPFWYGKFYLDPLDAIAHGIFTISRLASGSNPVYLIEIVMSKETIIGQILTQNDIRPDWSGLPPRPPSPLSLVPDPNIPDLQIFWLHDDYFPYVSEPETALGVNVPKHDIHPNYHTYREFVMANTASWFISPAKPMPKFSHPNELLAYGTFIDTLFQEAEQSSIQEVFGREFGFKDTPPPRLENERQILVGQESYSTSYGFIDGKQVLYKILNIERALREALLIRYLNVVLPGHTPKLLDFYFQDYNEDVVGVIALEFIDNTISAGGIDKLPAYISIIYRRETINILERELLAGIWCRDINEGNWLLKQPYTEQNPVIYRIDYGADSCFLTGHAPLTYNCKSSRSQLYHRLSAIISDEHYRVVRSRDSSKSVEDRPLWTAFAEELLERSSIFSPIVVPE